MSEELADQVRVLTETTAQLRAELDALREQVSAAQGRVRMTMREQVRCPGCGGTSILHSSRVIDSANAHKLHGLGLHRGLKWGKVLPVQGPLEIYICRACGLGEWYVKDLDDVDTSDEQFRIIEGATDQPTGPYR